MPCIFALPSFGRILLVDDDADTTNVMKRGLELAMFQVDLYRTGKEALENFRPGVYGLLLLDVRLPDINGFDLYEKLRTKDLEAKVCFVTAFDVEYSDTFRELYKHLNPHCFVPKPVSLQDLVRIVRKELGVMTDSAC